MGTLVDKQSSQKIIQCPNCQTKFGIDTSLIAGIEYPRFHCSRCDHVFTVEGLHTPAPSPLIISPPLAIPVEVEHETPPLPSETAPGDDFVEDTKILDDPAPKPSSSELHMAPLENAPVEVEKPTDTTEVAAPLTAQESPPSAPIPPQTSEGEQLSLDLPEHEGLPTTQDISVPPMSFSPLPTINPREMRVQHRLTEVTHNTAPIASTPQSMMQHTAPPTESMLYRRETSAWRSLILIALPIVTMVIVFALLAYTVSSSGESTLRLVQALLPNTPTPPPAGLVVRNVECKKTILDSGDSVWLISGKLLNLSTEQVRDVQIEAAAFNAAGEVSVHERVPLSTILLRSRIGSLTISMLQNLQHEPAKRVALVRPNDKSEFAIALVGPELAKGRSLSIRIYSARKS